MDPCNVYEFPVSSQSIVIHDKDGTYSKRLLWPWILFNELSLLSFRIGFFVGLRQFWFFRRSKSIDSIFVE